MALKLVDIDDRLSPKPGRAATLIYFAAALPAPGDSAHFTCVNNVSEI